jgi:signal transduction histidine kinase
VRAQVIEACERIAEQLGFPLRPLHRPRRHPGARDVAEHLVAVLREALSNAARHARAVRVDVEVAVDGSPSP